MNYKSCRFIRMKNGVMAGVVLALIAWSGLVTFLLVKQNQSGHYVKIKISFPKSNKNDNAEITLDDIFISVKTSGRFHSTRLDPILRTWVTTAKDQTYIFTDVDDKRLSDLTGGHMVNTKCGKSHHPFDLCCKMGHEYDIFAQSGKKWWCHVDDDNYVNVKVLLKVLRKYDWKSKIYLGKKSLNHSVTSLYWRLNPVRYWFLTGGAGVCISKGLRDGMDQWCGNGGFPTTCRNIDGPDDTTLGFIITNRLGVNVTERKEFNSHMQDLHAIPSALLSSQATVSYRLGKGKERTNIINLDEKQDLFNFTEDPTRFLSYHCLIYPDTDWCAAKKEKRKS